MKSPLELIKEISRVKAEIEMDKVRMNLKHSELNLDIERYTEAIAELHSEPQGVWKPKMGEGYHYVDNTGHVDSYQCENDDIDSRMLRHHNVYQTVIQSEKAGVLTKQANRSIQACINFDPDFVPNWMSAERKYSVGYYLNEKRWIVKRHKRMDSAVAYVSSTEIAQSICDLFNKEDNYSE